MSKQFVNDVASIAILATCWHEVPMPPLEGEVPNEREAEGFVRKLSKKTPQSARSGCQLPFQGSQGGFAARVAKLATPYRVHCNFSAKIDSPESKKRIYFFRKI